jgi:hypothetical protein
MALRNPTTAPRIVPLGGTRVASDRLDNGKPAFAVTQSFANPSGPGGAKHGALDLGNFNCGDKLLASVAGTVRNKRDSWGALICEVVEPSGALVGYAHLSRYGAAHGAKVARGAVIGYNGTTGNSTGCHCHYYRRSSTGVLQDPWPQLEQNQKRRAKLNAKTGINIRTGPGTQGGKMPPLYARVLNGRIIRASDNKDLGSAGMIFTAKPPTYGATHGVGSHPKSWTPIYLGGAYRAVAYPLTTYV